jgi:hypothetical protein
MMAMGGEAMLLDTTSGFEQPDAMRSPLSPLREGERTPSGNCTHSAPSARTAELDYATRSAGKISSAVNRLDRNLLDRFETGRAIRTVPKMTNVRAGAIFGLVGSDQLFVTLNAGYPKRGAAIG